MNAYTPITAERLSFTAIMEAARSLSDLDKLGLAEAIIDLCEEQTADAVEMADAFEYAEEQFPGMNPTHRRPLGHKGWAAYREARDARVGYYLAASGVGGL